MINQWIMNKWVLLLSSVFIFLLGACSQIQQPSLDLEVQAVSKVSKKLPTPASVNAGDHFGEAVALSGDLMIVGSPYDGNGSAYIYRRNTTGNWVFVKQLKPADSATGDRFGQAVAISGDMAVVGAFGKTVSGKALAGAAFEFA